MTSCHTMIVTWSIVLLASSSGWAQSLVAAVLPSSRSVHVGQPATAFATMINVGHELATDCGISPPSGIPATFFYAVDNRWDYYGPGPIDIPPGTAQHFIVGFIPHAPIAPTEVPLSFKCANTEPAPIFPGVSTLLLSASTTPAADVVAVAMTPTNDGIVNILLSGPNRTEAFAVATVNLGAGDAVTVSADTGDAILPVTMSICQTDPRTSACLSPPEEVVTRTIPSNEAPTFGIFVTAVGEVPFIPQSNRIFVRFKDGDGVTRGSTSVAVQAFICVPDPWGWPWC